MKLLIFLIMIVVASNAFSQTVEQELLSIEANKKALEAIIDRTPYKEEQHLIIEGYFKKLNTFALNVKDYSNTTKWFNNAVVRLNVEAFCNKVFIDLKRWEDLKLNCTRNGFFICAEEVRAFPAIKESLKASLWIDLQKNFDASKACKGI